MIPLYLTCSFSPSSSSSRFMKITLVVFLSELLLAVIYISFSFCNTYWKLIRLFLLLIYLLCHVSCVFLHNSVKNFYSSYNAHFRLTPPPSNELHCRSVELSLAKSNASVKHVQNWLKHSMIRAGIQSSFFISKSTFRNPVILPPHFKVIAKQYYFIVEQDLFHKVH